MSWVRIPFEQLFFLFYVKRVVQVRCIALLMREVEGYCSFLVCVSVCLSVCLSVTDLAVSKSIYTSDKQHPPVFLRL